VACTQDRFPLRVVNLRLEHDFDDHTGHVSSRSRR
jgi:hypothetical protein